MQKYGAAETHTRRDADPQICRWVKSKRKRAVGALDLPDTQTEQQASGDRRHSVFARWTRTRPDSSHLHSSFFLLLRSSTSASEASSSDHAWRQHDGPWAQAYWTPDDDLVGKRTGLRARLTSRHVDQRDWNRTTHGEFSLGRWLESTAEQCRTTACCPQWPPACRGCIAGVT